MAELITGVISGGRDLPRARCPQGLGCQHSCLLVLVSSSIPAAPQMHQSHTRCFGTAVKLVVSSWINSYQLYRVGISTQASVEITEEWELNMSLN